MSNAVAGMGTTFSRWTSSTWVALGEVYSISWSGKTRGTIDVTHFDSPDGYREFIGALRDGGTVQVSCNFTKSGYTVINNDFEDDEPQQYQIKLPDDDNTSLEFDGLVTEQPLEIPVDDRITSQVSIKVSGSIGISGS